MWRTAVFTLNDPPLACDGHVLIEISPLHVHVTFFVCTGDKFEKARCQMYLLRKQNTIGSVVSSWFMVEFTERTLQP